MDKQKQIEEIADFLIGKSVTGADSTKVLRLGYITVKEIASILVNAGYRKIPENAVVLTREEYERLNQAVDSVQVAVSSFTRLETLYKIKCKELELAEEKARKETAEKFAQALENRLDRIDIILHEDNEEEYLSANELVELIDEICKELQGE